MKPIFFKNPQAFRDWLEANHNQAVELWVGYYKKDSGRESITWPESVDAALCYGWIDGLRRSIDEKSYKIRFTPRRAGSNWSAVNVRRAEAQIELGLMRPAGMAAYRVRREDRSGIYSYERRGVDLEEPYRTLLERDAAAWDFFQSQPAHYRKAMNWWIISARREETRLKRLEKLAACSARGEWIPEMRRGKK